MFSFVRRKSLLLTGVSILALTALVQPLGSVFAAEQILNTDDGTDGTLTTGNSAKWTGTTGTDETFTVNDGTAVGDSGVVVSATTDNGVGELLFAGDSTATGTIGATSNRLGLLNLNGGVGKVVTITDDVFAVATSLTGVGSVAFGGDLTGSTLNYAANGSVSVAAGKNINATITTGTNNTGNLTFQGATTTGGTIGANGSLLKLINFVTGSSSIGHDLFATDINITGGTATYSSSQAYEGILTVKTGATLDVAGNTLTGTGTLVLDSGSTLKTEITSSTVAGKITTTGNASIDAGSTLNITISTGDFIANGTTFTIVDGTGGTLVSSGITIIDDSSVLSFTVSGGEDLIITAVRAASYTTAVSSGPAAGAAVALQDASDAGATGDMATIINALDALSTTEQSTAIETTAPESNGGTVAASLSAQNLSLGTVGNRLDILRNGETAGLLTGFSSGDVLDGIGIWAQGFGNTVDQNSHDETDGYEADTYGIAFGADKLVTDRVRVGLAYSYAYSDVDSTDASAGDGTTVDSHQATLYSGYRGNGYYVNAMLGGGYNMYDSARQVTIGSINRTAEGDYEGWQGTAKIGGGVNFKAGGSVITPTASLQYTHIALDSYNETGADSLNLSVDDQDYDVLQSSLGAKFAYPVKTDNGTFIPEVRAAWLYDFIGDKQQSTSTFSGGGGAFATDGADPAQNSVTVGASLSFLSNDNMTLAANYDAELKEDFIGHSGSLQLRIEF